MAPLLLRLLDVPLQSSQMFLAAGLASFEVHMPYSLIDLNKWWPCSDSCEYVVEVDAISQVRSVSLQ